MGWCRTATQLRLETTSRRDNLNFALLRLRGVEAVLRAILADARLDKMAVQGRYCRDIY